MKIGLITTLILSILSINTANAEYTAKIPLEKSGGGALPDNTIKLGDITNPVTPPNNGANCVYDNDNYYYQEFDSNNNVTSTSVVIDGIDIYFTVTKGDLVDSAFDGTGRWEDSEVCYSNPEVGTLFEVVKYEWSTDYVCEALPDLAEVKNIDLVLTNTQVYMNNEEVPPEEVTVDFYNGDKDLPLICNTRKRTATKIEQNTKTFETFITQLPNEILTVAPYETGDNVNVTCAYNKNVDENGYVEKWVLLSGSAYYSHFSMNYILANGETEIDTTRADIGAGYWARGKFMETEGSSSNYALCYWGGW